MMYTHETNTIKAIDTSLVKFPPAPFEILFKVTCDSIFGKDGVIGIFFPPPPLKPFLKVKIYETRVSTHCPSGSEGE